MFIYRFCTVYKQTSIVYQLVYSIQFVTEQTVIRVGLIFNVMQAGLLSNEHLIRNQIQLGLRNSL